MTSWLKFDVRKQNFHNFLTFRIDKNRNYGEKHW